MTNIGFLLIALGAATFFVWLVLEPCFYVRTIIAIPPLVGLLTVVLGIALAYLGGG